MESIKYKINPAHYWCCCQGRKQESTQRSGNGPGKACATIYVAATEHLFRLPSRRRFMTRISQLLLLPTIITMAAPAHSIQPIPAEPGWSGTVTVGAGALEAKTNMVAGIDRYSIDIGEARIDSLAKEPETESVLLPQFNMNINYTFSTQTQLFAGNGLEDIVQLDTVSVAGVRQQFSNKSILELGIVSSPTFGPVQVWKDPYVVGVDRERTDRTTSGLRIEYDKILGTGFGVQYTQREIEIEKELSGITQLGLSAAQAELLKRDGTTKRLVGSYRFSLFGRDQFELRVGLRTDDLDGKAMSGDMSEIHLTHVYFGNRFVTGINVTYFKKEFDAVNPVFGKTQENDTLGLGLFVFDKVIFGSKNWWGQASMVWVDDDSNIDFYDQSSRALMVGAQYRF